MFFIILPHSRENILTLTRSHQINPLLKFALATSPLVATIEHLLGISAPPPSNDYLEEASFSSSSSSLDPHTLPISSSSSPESSFNRERFSKLARAFTRPVLISSVVALAIIIPDFSRVMAILGSFSGILICVVGPLAGESFFPSCCAALFDS